MDQLATRYDAWWRESERERLRAWLRDQDAELCEIDARFDDLTSGDALGALRREADTATLEDLAESRRRWQHLVESAVLGAHARRMGSGLERRARAASRAQWRVSLAAEPDANVRRELQAAHERAHAELDELREELFARTGEARAELGYDTGRARARALHPQVDFAEWARAADALLEGTEAAWLDSLKLAARRAGIRGAAVRADLPRVLRSHALDPLFPMGRADALLDSTFDRMGTRLLDGVSLEVGSAVEAGARCFVPHAPGEVIVAVRGAGGLEAALCFFAASGRARAGQFCAESLPVERRSAIDPALARAWALLFENVLRDRAWAPEGPAQLRADELTEQLRLRNLWALRDVAARIVFESALADLPGGSDPHAQAGLFSECRERATALPHASAGYLIGADAELGSVHELRARCLAVQLAERLRARFGTRFWHERGASGLLKELWNTGGTYRAESLAADVELGPLDVAPLIEDALR